MEILRLIISWFVPKSRITCIVMYPPCIQDLCPTVRQCFMSKFYRIISQIPLFSAVLHFIFLYQPLNTADNIIFHIFLLLLVLVVWIGFFCVVWLATMKSVGLAKYSVAVTGGSALSAYSYARHARHHPVPDKSSD